MKKLIYITTNLQNTGGVSRILSVKLNYLIEKYHYNIYVINSNQNGNIFFYEFSSEIKFFSINTKNPIKYIKEINILIDNIEPDIIINCDNGLKGSFLPYLINSKAHLVYERHCSKNISVNTIGDKIKLMVSNFCLERSINKYNNFIVLNHQEKNNWKRKDILIIPNPIWFKNSSKIIPNINKIVVAVGRHTFEKRYDKLLNIWKCVVKENPDWILKIYGEKNKIYNIEQLVLEQDLSRNVELYKPINDLEKIYSEAYMLLTTSESESFPLIIIEAMAFGLPVIAFDNYGSKAIIDDGFNGFLIKKRDLNGYLDKVKLLMSDINLRKELGQNAMNSLERFDLDQTMKLWHDLFQSIQ